MKYRNLCPQDRHCQSHCLGSASFLDSRIPLGLLGQRGLDLFTMALPAPTALPTERAYGARPDGRILEAYLWR